MFTILPTPHADIINLLESQLDMKFTTYLGAHNLVEIMIDGITLPCKVESSVTISMAVVKICETRNLDTKK